MRFFITILFLFLTAQIYATKYYVSAAGSDIAAGTSSGTAWQTIAKVNSAFISLAVGDSILFRRGDTFTGAIIISRSGTAGNYIGFGSYGTGAKPIINGFAALSGWSLISGSIYEASLNTGLRLNLLTVDGIIQAPGRYPNFNTTDGGYLTITGHTPTSGTFQGAASTITASALTGTWTGAELVNRKNYYTFDREQITGQTGTTINYVSPSANEQENGFGMFIQHAAATLDMPNEWYYNSTANTLRIYGNPAGKVVKAATVESLVTISNKSYIGFRDLYFTGSDTAVFNITGGSSNIKIINCDMVYNGIEGVTVPQFDNCNNIMIDSCFINWTNSYPVLMYGASNISILNTVIKNSNTIPGLPRAGQSGYGAVYVDGGDNNLFEYNTIDTCGGTALGFANGNNTIARHNYINYYNLIMTDGAGIYTNSDVGTGRRITKNIVTNGIGSWQGTLSTVNRASNGIYADESARDIIIDSNTMFNMVGSGLYIHQSYDIMVRGNTIYDNQSSGIHANDDESYAPRIRNITIKGNYIFSKSPAQTVITFQSLADDLDSFTVANAIDSNYYARPFSDAGFLETSYQDSGSTIKTYYDVPGWHTKYGWGNHSIVFPLQINEFKFNSNIGSNVFTNPSFTSSTTGVTAGGGSTVSLESGILDGNAVKSVSTSGNIPQLNSLIHFGSLAAGKYYKLTFSLIGSTNTANLQIYFIGDNDYVVFGSRYFFPLRTSRVECEAYFYTNTAKADATCVLQSRTPLFPFWIDNVVLQEINATPVNISDSVRLEYNTTKINKTVDLVDTYKDPKGVIYPGSITLAPYSSAILRYVSAGGASNISPTASVVTPLSVILPASSVMLNGSGSSDSDGTIVSYAWSKLSGPGYSIDNAGIASPTVSTLTAGTYVFRLMVVDDGGASSTANVVVTVSATAGTNSFRLNGNVIFK